MLNKVPTYANAMNTFFRIKTWSYRKKKLYLHTKSQ